MPENLIDRAAVRLYRAVMHLPLGSHRPGVASLPPIRVQNPALRYRELQLKAEEHATEVEDTAHFWTRLNFHVTRTAYTACFISLLATLLVVREIRYYIAVSKAAHVQTTANTAVHKPVKKGFRVPFQISIPVAVVSGVLGYGCFKMRGRIRIRQLIELRKRDDFNGFMIRRRNLQSPLPEDCDLLEMHLARLAEVKRLKHERSLWYRTWRRLTPARWTAGAAKTDNAADNAASERA